MMRRLFCLLFFMICALQLRAQIAITPNVPTYPFQVLAGSTRQINVQITGGTLNTVNWSVSATTGSATATFTDPTHTAVSSISGALPTIQVNIGSTAGTCSISPGPGSVGPYTISSTATVTVQAQSVDDTTKTATFTFNVCANSPAMLANGTSSVIVAPAYQQAYQTQSMTLQSWVVGCVDETGTWSIVSEPSGGNGALSDTNFRDTLFSASVTGQYTIQYTSNCNGGTNTAIVYVSPNALPSYAATPNQTRPHECYPDPGLTGTDYEIGAGKAYTTINSTPAQNLITPGSIFRVWNTDTTGLSPSTYHEYYQIHNTGTQTQPIVFCGVPDSAGNLPIMDGSNATGQVGTSTGAAAGYGIVSAWDGGYGSTVYGYWQNGSSGPSYLSITGLHMRNSTSSFSYTPPAGGTATWIVGASCVNLRSGTYIDVSGNDLDTCGNGFFSAENANSAWAPITQAVTVMGNHIHNNGITGDNHEHQLYFQTFYGLAEGNLINLYNTAASGSNLKWRGVEGIFRYNYLGTGAARDFDLVENQDAVAYVAFENYFTYYDASPGNGAAKNDTLGANLVWYQESAQKDFIYGNLIFPSGNNQIHYAYDNLGGMNDRNGILYLYSNTLAGAVAVVDTGDNGNGADPIFPQRADLRNNLIWSKQLTGYPSALAINSEQTFIGSFTTNLYETGSMSIATPITGGTLNSGTAFGWQSGCDTNPCLWPLSSPINTHLYGLSSANFLLTPTEPVDPTTLAPLVITTPINGGTTLTGLPAQLPVRWQYSVNTSSLSARTQPQVIGAVEGSPPPLLTSITVAPSPVSVGIGATTQLTATCYYGGGTSADCTSAVVWTSSNTSVATIASGGAVTGVALGSTTITATSGTVIGTTSLSAYAVPTSTWTGMPMSGFMIQ